MNTSPEASSLHPGAPAQAWSVTSLEEVDSTQRSAADLPPWSVVVADCQTGGRGQRQRGFICDPGGLYLTAVVPFDGDAARWRGFALAVGRAGLQALQEIGVEDPRLRWPNDLMVGQLKVGGILVEQGGPRTLLVGLGLNITNEPWLTEPALRHKAGRLLEHCARAVTGPGQFLQPMLQAIRQAHGEFAALHLAGMVPELNRCWGPPHHVWLEPAGEADLPETEGSFAGIDDTGQVLLARPDGSIVSVPEHHIQRLVEVE